MILIPVEDCTEGGKNGKRWGKAGKCYTHDDSDAGVKAAVEKAIKQGLAEGGGKLENAEMSLEYLKAFHKFVTAHQHIYSAVKEEIHKRARGSAGGQAKAKKATDDITIEDMLDPPSEEPVKATNAAYVEGEITETDEYFDVPTVFTKEGVWTGTNGVPTLKTFDTLKASAPWFVGTPITPQHIETDTIRPSDRRLGHVVSATAREDKRDLFGISRYFKSLLNEDEITKLQNRQNLDGSPGYFTPVRNEVGDFGGKKYQAVEIGPYVVTEYATFFDGTHGACDSASGCGPFQNARGKKKEEVDRLVLDKNGKVVRCPKKQKNEADQMTEELISAMKADFEKQLNAANETIGNLTKTVSELTTKLDSLATEHKTLNEAFSGKVAAEVAATEAANKETFKKSLNAAAVTEVDVLWGEVKDMNPMQYEAWKVTNSAKLLNEAEKKDPKGKKQANASGFDLAAEQAKVFNY